MVGSVNTYSPAPQVSDLFEEKGGKLVPILQVSRFSFSTKPDVAAELRHTFFWLAARFLLYNIVKILRTGLVQIRAWYTGAECEAVKVILIRCEAKLFRFAKLSALTFSKPLRNSPLHKHAPVQVEFGHTAMAVRSLVLLAFGVSFPSAFGGTKPICICTPTSCPNCLFTLSPVSHFWPQTGNPSLHACRDSPHGCLLLVSN
jgi:hypothetical protein